MGLDTQEHWKFRGHFGSSGWKYHWGRRRPSQAQLGRLCKVTALTQNLLNKRISWYVFSLTLFQKDKRDLVMDVSCSITLIR